MIPFSRRYGYDRGVFGFHPYDPFDVPADEQVPLYGLRRPEPGGVVDFVQVESSPSVGHHDHIQPASGIRSVV